MSTLRLVLIDCKRKRLWVLNTYGRALPHRRVAEFTMYEPVDAQAIEEARLLDLTPKEQA